MPGAMTAEPARQRLSRPPRLGGGYDGKGGRRGLTARVSAGFGGNVLRRTEPAGGNAGSGLRFAQFLTCMPSLPMAGGMAGNV